MSNEANKLIFYLVKEFSSMKYLYKSTLEDIYDSAITHKGFAHPSEGKTFVINKVIFLLIGDNYVY